jgi:hypothetical protein
VITLAGDDCMNVGGVCSHHLHVFQSALLYPNLRYCSRRWACKISDFHHVHVCQHLGFVLLSRQPIMFLHLRFSIGCLCKQSAEVAPALPLSRPHVLAPEAGTRRFTNR